MFRTGDTLVAIASPTVVAARIIVRVSGPDAHAIVASLGERDVAPAHAAAIRVRLRVGDLDLPATRLTWRGPRSSTGEDVVELHVPGSPYLAGRVVDELLRRGCRPAEPGEFTARAFLHGRLDLTAAEGVAATIAATSRAQLDAARRLLAGELARRLTPLLDAVADTLALVEAGIDFSDEEGVSFVSRDEVITRIDATDASLAELLVESPRLERLAHEPRLVLIGRPNAGKSTLLNALAGEDRAVVSAVAGTTRDALSARVRLRRGFATLVDVAGIDPANAPGDDAAIAAQMQAAAHREAATADGVVLVLAPGDPPLEPPDGARHLRVGSKSDLAPADASASLRVSSVTGAGMDALRDALDRLAYGDDACDGGGSLVLGRRHVELIGTARAALSRAGEGIDVGPEVVAHELRGALDALGAVLGTVSPDDVLGRIFSRFCIGK